MSYLSNIAMRSAGPVTEQPTVAPAPEPVVNKVTEIESMEALYAADMPVPVAEAKDTTEITPLTAPQPSYLTRTAERVTREENNRTILTEQHNTFFGYSTTLPASINVYETNETHLPAPQNIEQIKTTEQIIVNAIARKEETVHKDQSPTLIIKERTGEPVVTPISIEPTPVQPVRIEQMPIEPVQLIRELQPPVAPPLVQRPASTVKHDKVIIGRITVEVIANTPQRIQSREQPPRPARKTTAAKKEFTSINKLSFGLGQL